LAAVYGLENKETFTGFTGEDITGTHSEQSYVDAAYVYGWTSGESATGIVGPNTFGTVSVDNDQNSITVALKYNF
jgi:hypothetical protein